MKLQILGCAGGIGGPERLTTCLMIDSDILLDAGTGLTSLNIEQLVRIDHVFITHCHLDHVAGLALLLDAVQGRRKGPVTVHATEKVTAVLKMHLFNWALWPDFGAIPDEANAGLRWSPLEPECTIDIGGRFITAHHVNHIGGSVAYRVHNGQNGFLFTGDMSSTPELWEMLRHETGISKVVVDCSFPNSEMALAELSRHFCPRALLADIASMPPSVEFLVFHLKPGHEDVIMQELRSGGGAHEFRALRSGDAFAF